jgi:hypothetical protein
MLPAAALVAIAGRGRLVAWFAPKQNGKKHVAAAGFTRICMILKGMDLGERSSPYQA